MEIKDNEIFLVSTDTVVGIGGKVNENNKKKIYELKKRDLNKPLIIVIGSIEQLKKMENINEKHLQFINKYWPGNVTLIINGNGYRMPNNKQLIEFIKMNGPFYLSSANLSNQGIINSVEEIKKTFPTLRYFDFGKGSGIPSIIIDTKDGRRIR